MAQNAGSFLPVARSLSFSEMQALLPLASKMEPRDVSLLAKSVPKLQPHMKMLIPALPVLSLHFRQLMNSLPLLLPHLDKLTPLLPLLTGSKDTVDCLPFLLEKRVLVVLLEHLDDIPQQTLEELPGEKTKYLCFLFLLIAAQSDASHHCSVSRGNG